MSIDPDQILFSLRQQQNQPPYYPPPLGGAGGGGKKIKHVKNGGTPITAFNTGTQTMGSATVTEYTCDSSGVLSSGSSLLTYNAGGEIAANAWGVVAMNEAGLWVWIVERCELVP